MSEDLRTLIQNTLYHTMNIKSFIESVVNNLGDKNDIGILQEMKDRADNSLKRIEENVNSLSKVIPLRQLSTPKKLSILEDEKNKKKVRKAAQTFEAQAKHHLFMMGLNCRLSSALFELKKKLEDFKLSVCKKRNIKGLDNFEYSKKENKNSYKLKARFHFGIDILIYTEDGTVGSHFVSLASESLNLKQLMAMFEVRWDYDLNIQDRNVFRCLQRAASWVDSRKRIFVEKCRVCDMHLSFKTGKPLLPLVTFQNKYYHVDCYYDMDGDIIR